MMRLWFAGILVFLMHSIGFAQPATQPATQPAAESETSVEDYLNSIEKTHGAQAWYDHAALKTEIEIHWGEDQKTSATLVMRPDMSAIRMDVHGGPALVYNDGKAWMAPPDSQFQAPRFHLLTWPYFIAAPFKLGDPGTMLKLMQSRQWNDADYDLARLTFASGVGDTPEDWYVLYRHPQSHRLDAMAYIVTYFGPTEEAEEEPHAVVYRDYRMVDGVALPMHWTFHHWSMEQGPHGDPIGEVWLREASFVEPAAEAFAKPEGAAPLEAPE